MVASIDTEPSYPMSNSVGLSAAEMGKRSSVIDVSKLIESLIICQIGDILIEESLRTATI